MPWRKLPIVYAVLAGSAGWLISFSPYYLDLSRSSRAFVGPAVVFLSPVLVWLSGYFVTAHFLPSWKAREKAYVSLIGYLVAGALAILLSAAWLGMNIVSDPAFQVILWPLLVALASYVLLRIFFRGRNLWATVSLSLSGYFLTWATLFYFLLRQPTQAIAFVGPILGWPVVVPFFLLGPY